MIVNLLNFYNNQSIVIQIDKVFNSVFIRKTNQNNVKFNFIMKQQIFTNYNKKKMKEIGNLL